MHSNEGHVQKLLYVELEEFQQMQLRTRLHLLHICLLREKKSRYLIQIWSQSVVRCDRRDRRSTPVYA